VLLPARRHGLRAYTSLFPYRTLAGPLLLAAIPTAGSPRQYELAYARPTGRWLPFGTLEVTHTTYRGHDLDLSFDPVLNVVPGLETITGLLNYAASPTPPLAERASTETDNPRPSKN